MRQAIIKSRNNQFKNKNNIKTIGPVLNLEEHVHPCWWNKIFNSLYLKTDADVVEDHQITSTEVDKITDILKLTKENKILDLCCGQGRHVIELTQRGFKVEGIDRSRYLIQKAKNIIKKLNIDILFREGDARKLPYQHDTFDIIMLLGNSFGYFDTIADDLRVLKEIIRIAKPSAQLLIDVTDGEYIKKNFETRSWEWINQTLFVCRERELSADQTRLISREVITHATKGVLADQFYAERLYTREDLFKLLNQAGFVDIQYHDDFFVKSNRNQDLGMMVKRIFITGKVQKEWSKISYPKLKTITNLTILLGDSSKPDIIKPNAIFDDDDFHTIQQLKSAVSSLKNYKVSYLNNHDHLIHNLIKNKNKIDFVFNLCDEGFTNDPYQELHIPSLLDILGIPYTGSGPQCLAYCYDKSLIRGIAQEMNIPVAKAVFIKPEDLKIQFLLDFPVIVKPNFGDSSFGITQKNVVNNIDDLCNIIAEIKAKHNYEKPLLVEEFLCGKDITVGIIGNPPNNYKILPIIAEDYQELPEHLPQICGYEAKWLSNSPYWKLKSVLADLPKDIEKDLIEHCLRLFDRLNCQDYCRFDWRLDATGQPNLLEVNPNPGWCWDGHLAKMAKFADMSYEAMINEILTAAENRFNMRKVLNEKN